MHVSTHNTHMPYGIAKDNEDAFASAWQSRTSEQDRDWRQSDSIDVTEGGGANLKPAAATYSGGEATGNRRQVLLLTKQLDMVLSQLVRIYRQTRELTGRTAVFEM